MCLQRQHQVHASKWWCATPRYRRRWTPPENLALTPTPPPLPQRLADQTVTADLPIALEPLPHTVRQAVLSIAAPSSIDAGGVGRMSLEALWTERSRP
jgi:hypothetical protein